MLTSFKIQNFRTFRQLRIEQLGQINLIVGKNNVGKSSLLEALRLYAHKGAPFLIWEILATRNEIKRAPDASPESDDSIGVALDRLFYGPNGNEKGQESIQIGPIDSIEDTLFITRDWREEHGNEDVPFRELPRAADAADNSEPNALSIRMGPDPIYFLPLDGFWRLRNRRWTRSESLPAKGFNCFYISADGLKRTEIGYLWDNIALTDLEQDILFALRIIASNVERLSLVGDLMRNRERMAVVKISGQTRPIPLSSMGDGMNRIFGIILALVNAKDGILLIDEIENGIHYTAQPNLWSLVFKTAHRLNVQVFATTHSWDCITAFQKAAAENKEKDGMLIRLEAKKEMTNTVPFDESELSIVSRDHIEVR
jgi:AAA15 family ATPase/GTPase